MKSLVTILLVAGSAAALAGMAHAQPGGPRAILFDQPNFQGRSVTVVEGSPNLGSWGFAARALSARFEGDWTVCDAPNLDGRCATVSGDVADLAQAGLKGIVSLGDGATDGAQSNDRREAAAAMTDATARSDQPVAAADDEQVPGARIGDRRQSFDAPPAPTAAQVVAASAPAPGPPIGPEAARPVAYSGPQAPQAPASAAQAVQGDAGRTAVFFAKPMRGGAEVAIDAQGPANQFCRDQGLGPAVYFDTDGHTVRDVLCRRP